MPSARRAGVPPEVLQEWDLDFEEKKSLTSKDSFILNIKKINKKIL